MKCSIHASHPHAVQMHFVVNIMELDLVAVSMIIMVILMKVVDQNV